MRGGVYDRYLAGAAAAHIGYPGGRAERPVVTQALLDEADYRTRYPDIGRSLGDGRLGRGQARDVGSFFFEGRYATPMPPIFA